MTYIGQRRGPTGHFFLNVAGQLNGQLLRIFATRNPKIAPQSDLTLSTALAGTPVIAAMLSGLVPHDLVLRCYRCHPRSWFCFILFTGERYRYTEACAGRGDRAECALQYGTGVCPGSPPVSF